LNKERQICVFSVTLLVLASFFSVGYHHFDEHFQILEFAGLKLGLTTANDLPWEYHNQMRPAFQPAITVIIYKILCVFGLQNPFTIAFILRLISAVLAFSTMYLIYRTYVDKIKNDTFKFWFLLLSFALPFLIYNGVRFSSENWSGAIFVIGFCLYVRNENKSITNYFVVGAILGLSFLFRYQAAFFTFGFIMWLLFIKKEKLYKVGLSLLGTLVTVGVGVLVDKWYYGEWTLTTWNYFEQNILLNKVSSFGVDPWWYYFAKFFEQGIPPFSLVFIITILLLPILKPKSAITWSVVPFLLIHFAIGHKEMRFLFPMVYFLPIITIQVFEILENKYVPSFYTKLYSKIFVTLFATVFTLFSIVVCFKPADTQISLYNTIYGQYDTPTVLYFENNNPYHRVLDIKFYKRDNLEIRQIDSFNNIPSSQFKNVLIVQEYKSDVYESLIYSSYPTWLSKFNINNWMDRARTWYVYEVK